MAVQLYVRSVLRFAGRTPRRAFRTGMDLLHRVRAGRMNRLQANPTHIVVNRNRKETKPNVSLFPPTAPPAPIADSQAKI
jgi:hypothetical protein